MSETKHTRPEREPLTERGKAEKFVDEQLEKLKANALSADDPQRTRTEARNALTDCVASHDSLVKALEAIMGSLRRMSEQEADIFIVQAACDSLALQAEAALTAARTKRG